MANYLEAIKEAAPSMDKEFARFLANLFNWLTEDGYRIADRAKIRCWTKNNEGESCDVVFLNDEGEELYIGNFIDPGMTIKWLGQQGLAGKRYPLVIVNGIVMQAVEKLVCPWLCERPVNTL
jgi:hypothetical protein